MSKLIDLIREQRRRRAGTDDFVVIILRDFSDYTLPHAHIGNSGTVLEQAPEELFETFQARAINAAKAAGATWGLSISVPDGCCEPAQAVQADKKKLNEMTGAQIVALAKQGLPLSSRE